MGELFLSATVYTVQCLLTQVEEKIRNFMLNKGSKNKTAGKQENNSKVVKQEVTYGSRYTSGHLLPNLVWIFAGIGELPCFTTF